MLKVFYQGKKNYVFESGNEGDNSTYLIGLP